MMNSEKNSCEFEALLKEACHPPVVFHHVIDSWPARKWTLSYLTERLKSTQFQCKISPRDYDEVLMETDCLHLQCSLCQYEDWLSGKPGEDNPLSMFDPAKYSCYVDYKYMKDMFAECSDVLKEVNWESFGFPGRDGADSTIWIGSAGAYTPCHQDTYGFNFVAQIAGSKRWFLFPPSASEYMYPTRIPFEESSVFSEVNVRYPDLNKHPLFQKAEPHVVILNPGEVLYVPRHWWHFVECLEPSISVNTWVEMREDVETHLEEAVTRFLFTSMSSLVPTGNLTNSYEELESPEINIQYMKQALTAVRGTRDERHPCTQSEGKDKQTDRNQTLSCVETSESLSSHQLLPESCYSSSLPDNFRKFMDAFKVHKVTVCDVDIGSVCACTESGKKRKRCDLEGGQDEDSDLDNSAAAAGGKSVDSKIVKHEQEVWHMERSLNDLENYSYNNPTCLHSSETTNLSDTCVHNVANKGNQDEQNSENLIKTNINLNSIRLCTVPKLSFDDYTEFLKFEFDFDKTEYLKSDDKNYDDEEVEIDTIGTKAPEIESQATETFNINVINSILDQSVVKIICRNLMRRC